ncbi:hypothetical protein O3M35_008704 [Rhynocoris fuscipes]|uniref:Reverse transcriptase domain-containing protein n=1 Tax=Rhynocoris fuscipes TaxID=488301 RepID=A0AAW1D8G9_9HEMI
MGPHNRCNLPEGHSFFYNDSGSNPSKVFVSVEWVDKSGEAKYKMVPTEDFYPDIEVNDENRDSIHSHFSQEEGSNRVNICGYSFKNQKGLRIHLSMNHPIESNKETIRRIIKDDRTINSSSRNNSMETEVREWETVFSDVLNDGHNVDVNDLDLKVDNFRKFLRRANQHLPGPKHRAVEYFQLRNKKKSEICEPNFVISLGYKLNPAMDGILLTDFADDQAVTTNNIADEERVVTLLQILLREVGLPINPCKSTAIIINDGAVISAKLFLEDGEYIQSAGQDEAIKYLECKFSGEIVLNDNSIKKFNNK